MATTDDARRGADIDASRHPVRPALPVLQEDQRALFSTAKTDRYGDEHYLRGGFPHRRAVIAWYQRAIVRTFGHVADEVPAEALAYDNGFMACMVVGEERTVWDPQPFPLEKARRVRQKFEAKILRPACNRAFNDLRKVAGEYIDEEDGASWTDLDPEGQRHVAMRPEFQRLDAEQAVSLEALWGGFDDRDALYDWLHDLDDPTNGAIREDMAALAENDPAGVAYLLDQAPGDTEARRFREWFAIGFLLPAFVDGISQLSAGELAARTSDPLEPTQG